MATIVTSKNQQRISIVEFNNDGVIHSLYITMLYPNGFHIPNTVDVDPPILVILNFNKVSFSLDIADARIVWRHLSSNGWLEKDGVL